VRGVPAIPCYRFCPPKSCASPLWAGARRGTCSILPTADPLAVCGATWRSRCTRCHSRDTRWRKRDTSWRTRDTSGHFLSLLPESVAEVTKSDRLCLTGDNQRQFVTRYRRARWSFVKQNCKRSRDVFDVRRFALVRCAQRLRLIRAREARYGPQRHPLAALPRARARLRQTSKPELSNRNRPPCGGGFRRPRTQARGVISPRAAPHDATPARFAS